jgi:hypothetical protein
VVRPALFALGAIVLLSFFLTSRPLPKPSSPDQGVTLEQVKLTLYPEQDREAQWEFAADKVRQNPSSREAVVSQLRSGERFVDNQLDLRLFAPEVVIDQNDNLRLPYTKIEILKGCYTVNLGQKDQMPVIIDQREGFIAPSAKITSPTVRIVTKTFKSDFALTNPVLENGGDQATDYLEGEPPPCTIPGGQS